jgi:thymidylate synthase (FAD)
VGSEKLEKSLGMKTIHQLGFVKLLDVMGDDEEVENSARISYGEGTRKVNQTRNLIRYLMRHKHTSPFEMCEVKFHLKLPIFIMRQLVRHRTANLNEYSGRYSVMSNEFYLPEGDYLAKQSTTNKQGRGEPLESQGLLQFEFNRIYDGASMAYQVLLEHDLSREVARALLPVANYTECIWKIDLHNFFHFVKLRSDSHAQREIRDYADAMYELVKPNFPMCCEAFEDYIQGATTFSKQEMEVIKDNMSGSWTMNDYNLSERESTEFLEKIKKGDAE